PAAVEEQALLRAVAQVALFVGPSPCDIFGDADLGEQIAHLGRVVAGHGQVVRRDRARDAADVRAAAVAARAVFEFEHDEVFDAREPQSARGRQTRDAAAGDDDAGLARDSGRRRLRWIAQ